MTSITTFNEMSETSQDYSFCYILSVQNRQVTVLKYIKSIKFTTDMIEFVRTGSAVRRTLGPEIVMKT